MKNINEFISIKPIPRRFLVPIFIMVLILVSSSVGTLIYLQQDHMEWMRQQALNETSQDLKSSLMEQITLLGVIENIILTDIDLRDALKAGDRLQLLTDYKPIFTHIRDVHSITHLYFHGPGRINLLRLHDPDKYGDFVESFTLIAAERTGTRSSGIELDSSGILNLRAVQAIFDKDILIGYIELGKGFKDIFHKIKTRNNIESVMLIKKTYLKRAQWERSMTMPGRVPDWEQYPDFAIGHSSLSRVPATLTEFIRGNDLFSSNVHTELILNGISWCVTATPVNDTSGTPMGNLILLKDNSEGKAIFHNLMLATIFGGVLILTILFVLIYSLLRKSSHGILDQQMEMSRLAELLQNVINTSQDLIFVKDTHLRTILCNDFFAQVLNKKPEDLYGRTDMESGWPVELVQGDPQKGIRGFEADDLDILAGETIHNYADSALIKNEIRYFDTIKTPLRDRTGKIIGVLGIGRDITERQKAENELKNSEEYYRSLIDLCFDGIRKTVYDPPVPVDLPVKEQARLIHENSYIVEYNASYANIASLIPASGQKRETSSSLLNPAAELYETYISNGYKLENYETNEILKDGTQKYFLRNAIGKVESGKLTHDWGVLNDITERKLAEKALRESEKKYRGLLENSPDGITIVNAKGEIEIINRQLQKMTGYTPDELIGQPVEILIPERFIKHRQKRNNYLASPHVRMIGEGPELFVRRKDGSEFSAEISLSPLSIAGDLSISAVIRDISERKKAEKALKKSEALLEEAQRIAHVGSWEADHITDRRIWSDEMCRIFEVESGQPIKSYQAFLELTHPDDRERFDRVYTAAINENTQHYEIEFRLLMKDGRVKHIQLICENIFDKTGVLIRCVGIAIDITARKQADEELHRKDRDYRTLFETSQDGISFADLNGCNKICNEAFSNMVGYSKEELQTICFKQLTPVKWHAMETKIIEQKIMREGYSGEYEKEYIHKDGTIFPVALRVLLIKDAEGKPEYMVAFVRDITESKRAERIIKSSEEKYRQLVEDTNVLSWETDIEATRFTYVSPQAEKITGFKPEQWYQSDFWLQHIHPDDKDRITRYYQENIKRLEDHVYEYRMIKANGEIIWFHDNVKIVYDEHGTAIKLRGVMLDITSRKEIEKKAAEAYKNQRMLTMQLEKIRENERLLISHEIHDEFGQALTILKMDLAWLRGKLSHCGKAVQKKIKSMDSLILASIDTVRKISANLRPAVLDDLGLNSAIEWYCNETSKRSAIAYNVSGHAPDNLPENIKTTLFRIFQEAVTNIVRHSRADEFDVELQYNDPLLVMIIRDDGIGIDENKIASTNTLGILGMKERAYQLGGEVMIKNRDEGGVQLTVCVSADGSTEESTPG